MKKLRYLVRISQDPGSDWGASVPDLPGCIAVANTLDGAIRRIRGAIELHLEGMREDGSKPPRPRHRSVVPKQGNGEVDVYARVDVEVRVA
jgi:predicted RNase H-like HicB family nuclease